MSDVQIFALIMGAIACLACAFLLILPLPRWHWTQPPPAPPRPACPPPRKRLDDRRDGIRETITFKFSGEMTRDFDVTFNRDAEGVVREVFCAGAHTQSDLQGLVEDSCIALSLALQYGARIADIAKSFGELRDEGSADGPPASPLGTIARRGAEIEAEFAEAGPA